MHSLMRPWKLGLALLLVSACSLQTHASTVLEMSFQDVLDHAELVFEGRVSAVESLREDDGMIHTYVRFEVLDVLKGDTPGAVLKLRFLGGTVGTQRLDVTDMTMPEMGESGLYFVESLSSPQVNPLVGWAQGHFLIEPQDGGVPGVLTANHEPVLAVDAADAAPVTAAMNTFSKGVAKGVVVQESLSAQAASRPLTVDEFKRSVRALVNESQ
jgi:hypothetical protein